MGNVSDKICSENQNTHFAFNISFHLQNRAAYEIMLQNIVERGRPQDDKTAQAHCMPDT
jgi:hypothetical protein